MKYRVTSCVEEARPDRARLPAVFGCGETTHMIRRPLLPDPETSCPVEPRVFVRHTAEGCLTVNYRVPVARRRWAPCAYLQASQALTVALTLFVGVVAALL